MKRILNYKIFESQENIVDSLMDRVKSYNIDNDYKLSIARPNSGMFGKGETPGKSYRVALLDRKTNKVASVAYVMEIKPMKDGKIKAQIRRVHTEKNYRGKGLMSIVLQELVKNFGDLYLYLYASPNRVDGLTDGNREEYREKLFKLYGKFGFKLSVGASGSTHKWLETHPDHILIMRVYGHY